MRWAIDDGAARHESSGLLGNTRRNQHERNDARNPRPWAFSVLVSFAAATALLFVAKNGRGDGDSARSSVGLVRVEAGVDANDEESSGVPIEGSKKKKKLWSTGPPNAERRCKWVVEQFTSKYKGRSEEELRKQFPVQAADSNVFYRATANIFWKDFALGGWGDRLSFESIGIDAKNFDGTPLQPKSTWTWVTGDQHLSNFGAWRNRHGDVVFSVNDFDEAAIYDFQLDVLRIAVSVCSHAFTNGLSHQDIKNVLRSFTETYVFTVINYVGGDHELLYELTPQTATGALQQFLLDLRDGKSPEKQLEKFTEVDSSGRRSFIKNAQTRLVEVSPAESDEIRNQFTVQEYGSTMMKMGWHVRNWDDEYFEVLDVAARVGSGIGSYGVDRYYVLLRGEDGLLGDDGEDGNAIILDVKYEPPPAVSYVLDSSDSAWYGAMFKNDAARAVEAQRRLTSYVDPFTGWVSIDNKPFVVRQRSPWKDSPDINSLDNPADFIEFMEQVAVATATSHSRGTVSKSPGQFKHVIASSLGHWSDRKAWGKAVAQVAYEYRDQVLMDFECFQDFVKKNYS